MADVADRLASWFAGQLPDARAVSVEGVDRVEVGHSAETLLMTLVSDGHRRDVVVRVRPPTPGLLEPYDLRRQHTILQALDATPVRAPRALWFEPTGEALGREFYVMERLPGQVYEQGVPDEVAADPARIRRMCEGIVEQLATIHTVDLRATGLDAIADGHGYVDRELAHWAGETERVRTGPLPALDRLVGALRERQPDPCPTITLVHGDAKPGNIAFEGAEVSAVFDWEMATVGDPLADLGWAEVNWTMPGNVVSTPGAPPVDELVARWEQLTGITARHRPWYRSFQLLKMTVILLVGAHLFDAGHSDDARFAAMAPAIPFLTQLGLDELGIDGGAAR
jgi:aminoglycoside phosphotransferase (APT) family kinase protein